VHQLLSETPPHRHGTKAYFYQIMIFFLNIFYWHIILKSLVKLSENVPSHLNFSCSCYRAISRWRVLCFV